MAHSLRGFLTVRKAKAIYITVGQEAEGGGTRDQATKATI